MSAQCLNEQYFGVVVIYKETSLRKIVGKLPDNYVLRLF